MINCNEVEAGSYSCSYRIYLPWKTKFPWEDESQREPKCVSIDKCLLPEIIGLWELGIKTTGCCCGHGNKEKAFIGVQNEYIQTMKDLGYQVAYNPYRPNDEDSFCLKTQLVYGTSKVLVEKTEESPERKARRCGSEEGARSEKHAIILPIVQNNIQHSHVGYGAHDLQRIQLLQQVPQNQRGQAETDICEGVHL